MFPSALPNYSTITTPITLRDMHHASRHSQMQADITAIATKLGVDSSSDVNSIDYKLAQVIGSFAAHAANTSNPHNTTKSQVGLGNVDNTSDATKLANFLLAAYPVGSIYISTVNTNPGTLFGGTWAAFAAGRTLIGVGTSDQTFAAGNSGGESNHTLTSNEMPSHRHDVASEYGATANASFSPANGTYGQLGGRNAGTRDRTSNPDNIGLTGGGAAHNNLPPYIVVYMWQRTA